MDEPRATASPGQAVRRLVASVIAVLLLDYLGGVVVGWIHPTERLSVSDLGVVVLVGILVVGAARDAT